MVVFTRDQRPYLWARCICQTEPVKTLTFEEEAERLRDFDTEEPRVIISGNSANPGCRSKAEPAAFARNAIQSSQDLSWFGSLPG